MFNWSLWTARALIWLCTLFLAFDTVLHLLNPPAVVDAFARLGYSDAFARPLGAIELVGLILLIIPRTAVFGIVYFTAYLGGATAAQVRIGGPAWFSILCGLMLWAGAYLEYPKVREIVPTHKR